MIPGRLIIVLLVLLPSMAAADDATAVVARYLPPKAEHIIVRTDGEDMVAGLGTPLYAGDTVRVADGGSLVIAFADGAQENLEGPATFAVPNKEPMGMAARIYDRLQVILGRQYRQGSNLATRGGGSCDAATPPLDAPVLGSTTYLSVGHDNIALAWVGGCRPYSLTFEGAGGADIRMDGLQRPLTRINTQGFVAGDYSLAIRDAGSREISVAVVLTDLPDSPIAYDDIQSELDAVAFAAWLANHDEGRWRLESFQQIRPWIRDGGALAGTFGDLIMWGDPSLELHATD